MSSAARPPEGPRAAARAAAPLLLDTNIISALMRDARGPAGQRLQAAQNRGRKVCTSVVVQCELMFGLVRVQSARLSQAHALVMKRLDVLALDNAVPAHYAALRAHLQREGSPIGPNDALIAAHALALEAVLITDNETEFRRVPGLQVENWLR